MPIIPGRKPHSQLPPAPGQTIDVGIERRLGDAGRYRVLRQEISGVTGLTAISLVAHPNHPEAGRRSIYEINAAALLGDGEENRLVVGRYFMDADGHPVLRHGNPLNRAYRIGQAQRVIEDGRRKWQKVYGTYTDSQLVEDSSLTDMNAGLWAGMGRNARDALNDIEATMQIRRAIVVGHSALYGIDLVEPHLQGALDHINGSRTELAS